MRAFLTAFVVLALGLAACTSEDVERRDDGSLVLGGAEVEEAVERGVVPGARALVIDHFAGTITLSGTADEGARLTFTKKGRGSDPGDARKALGRITIDERGDDAAYHYTLRSGDAAHTSVDVTGTVPARTRLELRLASGTVVVRRVEAPLTIRVENGSVQVAGAASDVSVTAQNGDLTVAMAALPAQAAVKAETQNGQVRVGLPTTAGARIEASTGVGRIVTNGLAFRGQRLDPQGAGARFRATLGSGAARVTLSTHNGAVELVDADRLTAVSAVPPQGAQEAPAVPADTVRR